MLGRVEEVEHQTGVVAAQADAVDAVRRDLQRHVATGGIGIRLHDEELHLVPEHRLVAERVPGLDGADERVARRDGKWAVVVLEVGDDDVGVDLPTRPPRLPQRHRGEVGEPHVGRVAGDVEDVALDVHRQRGDGVVTVLTQAPLGHVTPVRQAVEVAPHDSDSSVPHRSATLAKAHRHFVRSLTSFRLASPE